MLTRHRRRPIEETFSKTLENSRDSLKKVEEALRSQMPQTISEIKKRCDGSYGDYNNQENANLPEIAIDKMPKSTEHSCLPEAEKELEYEHDYETPYGAGDEHRFHAVCTNYDGKLIFLSENDKSLLSDKINSDSTLADVIAIYEGKLTYFEERRIIQIL